MTNRIGGRVSLLLAAMLLGGELMDGVPGGGGAARGEEAQVTTHAFKRVGDLEILLDLHRPAGVDRPPLVVWIHGGALIMGHRAGIDGRVKRQLLESGFAIASIDYRLAPETKLPEILSDVEDAFTWLRRDVGEPLHVDASRIVVMGGSAGGYLTLAAGHRVRPPPAALVAFYGYGDLVGDWYSRPSPHPRHFTKKMSEEEAFRHVAGPPISDSRQRPGDGGAFYQFCRQHGSWPRNVSGWDPHTEAEKFFPYMPVKNVTPDYPPTMLIHGTADTDVPYEQSVMMVEQLKKNGVAHELISIANGEHGFGGGDPKQIDAAYASVMKFVQRHARR